MLFAISQWSRVLTFLYRYGPDERLTEAYAPDIWNDY